MSHPTFAARLWTVAPTLIAFVASSLGNAAVPAAKVQKPNIVFVLADDIGYGDLSCYGATLVHTKNLDRLAGLGPITHERGHPFIFRQKNSKEKTKKLMDS